MKVKDFIEGMKCPRAYAFRYMEPEDMSSILLNGFLRKLCDSVLEMQGETITEETCRKIGIAADREFSGMLAGYKAEWFGGGEQQLLKKKELNTLFYKRFMEFFLAYLQGAKVLEANKYCQLTVENKNGKRIMLEDSANLILQKDSGYVALVFNCGKNYGRKSLNGRSDSTRIECDMRYAFLKTALEPLYNGINIGAVYFQEGESKGRVLPWVSNDTQKSNFFLMPFADAYENSEFNPNACLSRAECVLEMYAGMVQSEKCANCMHKSDCAMQTISERHPSERVVAGNWKLPTYDESQRGFVEFAEGELLVCAGPGSGKTASLVGRVCYLAEHGREPERMLLVSYTEKAAEEIRNRLCLKFPEDEMPRICTLHSLAAEIDWFHAKSKGIKPHRILTESMEKGLVKKVLDSYPGSITGIDYRNYVKGRFNTVSTVYRALKEMEKNEKDFFFRHTDYVMDEWHRLSLDVHAMKKQGNYFTYDEMIMNASRILREEKTLRDYYNQKYRYIVVDEYQDINREQEELITLLEGDNGNLACIGDDDQAIYGFKGCSSEYMQKFSTRHPNALSIKFQKNYRSTKNIVSFINHVLKNMDEKTRIGKIVEYAEYAEEGSGPVLYEDNSAGTVDAIIEAVVKKGYRYDDIAVIATKNISLTVLNDALKAPTALAAAFIINDFLFHAVKHTLAIVGGMDVTCNPLVRLGLLFEKDKVWFENISHMDEADGVARLLSFAGKLAGEKPEHYVARLSAYLDMDGSESEGVLLDIARNSGAENLGEFYNVLSEMSLYEDNRKVDYPVHGRVTLITAHSCKGKEWPVVIVYDTDSFSNEIAGENESSMDARLFYVAASRAKKELIFLKNNGSKSILDTVPQVKKLKLSC